jgi:hypothetical protein
VRTDRRQIFHRVSQGTEGVEHLSVGEVRVPAARVRKDEDARAVHRRVLEPRLDCRRWRRAERLPQHPIEGHADKRDDRWPQAIDLLFEPAPAFDVFVGPQFVNAWTRPSHHVRHAKPPLRQPHVVGERDPLRHEAGFVQQLPEPVRRSGKVMPRLRRSNTWIDADQQNTYARLNAIREAEVAP